ncbi:MAG: DUF6057 family protein [Phycisphaerales bacterium]
MQNVGRRPVNTRERDSVAQPVASRRWTDAMRSAVFFAGVYLYLWLWVQPCLIYSCATITDFPVFYKGWVFFQATVQSPGGLTRYVSAFVSQLLLYSWAGAAVIVVQAWAICACTGCLLRAVRLPGARLLRFVPAVFAIVAYARYSFHLPMFTGALVSLACACLYVRYADRSRAVGIWLVLSAIAYVVGGAAFLPFAGLCMAYELCRRRWRRIGLYLPVAAALPYVVGVLVFRISLVNAYTDLLPMSWRVSGWPTREQMVVAVYVVYLFTLVGVLVAGLGHALQARWGSRQAGDKPHAGRLVRCIGKPAVQWAVGTLVLFAAGGAAAVYSLDREQKASLTVHYYACRRMWPQVLHAARHCPNSPHVMAAVNLALYHTGRLNQDMFLHVQTPDGLLRTGDDHVVLYWHAFDTLIDLGLANLAEKNLTECLETFGEHPWILERLAKVNLIKGKTAAARVYLGALRKTLFPSRWATECLSRLDADPNLADDSDVQRLRAQRLRMDSPALFYTEDALLTALVEQSGGIGPQLPGSASGPPNRMAFEYLMARYLLTGQLDRIAQQIARLDEFGYAEIPPLWQEAILIYSYGERKVVNLYGRSIDPEMDRRIKHFSSVVNKHGKDRDAAIAELAKDYRGSYFFYRFCTRGASQ